MYSILISDRKQWYDQWAVDSHNSALDDWTQTIEQVHINASNHQSLGELLKSRT